MTEPRDIIRVRQTDENGMRVSLLGSDDEILGAMAIVVAFYARANNEALDDVIKVVTAIAKDNEAITYMGRADN